MRIQELNLKAYGPFCNRSLDFSSGSHGLHVIYGPNEAGKSTALRALRSLLYGVDERTTDAFLHGTDQLRIGGRVRSASGQELTFFRRKGRKNTLLSADETRAIDDAALAPFLAGVSEDVFSSLFGIDHQELVQGGDQILQQKGEVGQALFAAALGSQHFYAVLRELEEEAADLYRPHASKYPVNSSLAEVAAARRRVKEASLQAKDWASRRKQIEDLTTQLKALQAKLDQSLREKSTVARLQRVLPMLARRKALLDQLRDLGTVIQLPSDFAARRKALAGALASAEQATLTDTAAIDQVRSEIKKLPAPTPALSEAAAIEAAVQDVGSYRKSLRDRPANEGKRQQARNDARDILKGLRSDITLDHVETLRPLVLPAKRQIQDLTSRHQALEATERSSRKALADADSQVQGLARKLVGLPKGRDVGPLRRVLANARRTGNLDHQISDSSQALARLAAESEADLRSLGLWSGALQEFVSLPLPIVQTIDRFEIDLQEAHDELRTLGQERQQLVLEAKKVAQAIGTMQAAGAIASEAQLLETRSRRDTGWRLVKDAWSSGADVTVQVVPFDPKLALSDAYEGSVLEADAVADKLRSEADRVATYAHQVARRDELAASIAEIERRIAQGETSENSKRQAWARNVGVGWNRPTHASRDASLDRPRRESSSPA